MSVVAFGLFPAFPYILARLSMWQGTRDTLHALGSWYLCHGLVFNIFSLFLFFPYFFLCIPLATNHSLITLLALFPMRVDVNVSDSGG